MNPVVRRSLVSLCMSFGMAIALTLQAAAPSQAAIPLPHDDPFYTYSGPTPLKAVARGTVLKTRSVSVGVPGTGMGVLPGDAAALPDPGRAGSADGDRDDGGQPDRAAQPRTGRLPQLLRRPRRQVLAELHAAGRRPRGGELGLANSEAALVLALAAQGYAVTVPDFEGPDLHWVAGHESGWNTLDGIRATESYLGMPSTQKVGLFGYSGGSIGGEWASELAPSYAPELNIVGTAIGGIPVHLAHNTRYVNGSDTWSGVMPAVLVSLGRAFGIKVEEVRLEVRQAGDGRGAGPVHRRRSTATTRGCGSSSCSRRSTTPSSRSGRSPGPSTS